MFARVRTASLLLCSAVLFSGGAWAQISAIEGDVKGADGSAIKGAEILIERKDMKGTYKGAKSDKKGHYIYNGLPLGTYKVSVIVDGQVRDNVDGVRTKLGDPVAVNFDLKAKVEEQKALAKAVETGTLTKEQERGLTKEQKAEIDKRTKENAAAMAKNKELNDAFNGGMQALEAKNYDAAVDSFTKASVSDPKQEAVWANLARAYNERADAKKTDAAARQADLDKAVEAYGKAIELKPDQASLHLNLALALANEKKIPEAKAELEKAAQMDPTQAGKAYYNLGAILINSGQTDPAAEAFKKATDLDPNYADAYYQYGVSLMGKMQVAADGKVTYAQGTKEAFDKYLQLKPDGSYADPAKAFLTSMGATIETKYSNPNAPAPKKPAAKKK
ncbi:MAG: tetratricopeptide repeat protein [Acidobacteriota bacterium]|nr:tetratricopeptide repeat protein [Acidobacteriota bacterium]